MTLAYSDRIRGALWGFLVGDAMGVPHEFKHLEDIPESIRMVMPSGYQKTWVGVPYGTWSDDGALTLATVASLVEVKGLDIFDLADKMVDWLTLKTYTATGVVFDIGSTTHEALLRLINGQGPQNSGLSGGRQNGNGSLMRVLPLALWSQGSDSELFEMASEVSGITHAHPISRVACGVYCVAARHLGSGLSASESWDVAFQCVPEQHGQILDQIPKVPTGSGFVLDSLSYAIQATKLGLSYPDTVLGAIRLGFDTDTTAAIAGGLAGIIHGVQSISSDWVKDLRGREIAEPLIEGLVSLRCR